VRCSNQFSWFRDLNLRPLPSNGVAAVGQTLSRGTQRFCSPFRSLVQRLDKFVRRNGLSWTTPAFVSRKHVFVFSWSGMAGKPQTRVPAVRWGEAVAATQAESEVQRYAPAASRAHGSNQVWVGLSDENSNEDSAKTNFAEPGSHVPIHLVISETCWIAVLFEVGRHLCFVALVCCNKSLVMKCVRYTKGKPACDWQSRCSISPRCEKLRCRERLRNRASQSRCEEQLAARSRRVRQLQHFQAFLKPAT
jgi:hypothetical protein